MIVFCLLLTGCGYFEKPSHTPSTPNPSEKIGALHEKFSATFDGLVKDLDPDTGWPDPTDCDGTLWAGLAKSVGLPVKLELSEYAPGEIHRRPLANGECYNGESGSTVSNDMLAGYSAGIWATQDLGAMQRLADYGEKNNWTMGLGDVARTVFRPNGYGLLGRMVFGLSTGTDDRSYRKIPPLYLPVTADYEKHLMVEGIVLNGQVNEYLRLNGHPEAAQGLLDVNSNDLTRLQELSGSEPTDILVQAAYATYTGDFTRAIDLALDDQTPVPTYVRGGGDHSFNNYPRVYWLKSVKLILDRYPAAK